MLSPSIAVYKRMNVVDAPQNIRGEHNRIGPFPFSVYAVYKIVHQGRNAIICWRLILTHVYGARAIFARVHMQATNGVEIKRLNDVLRQKRLPMSREA
jgi:hypothetical protein